MQCEDLDWREISLLIFGLRINPPEADCYDQIRDYLNCHKKLIRLVPIVQSFLDILRDLCYDFEDVSSLQRVSAHTKTLVDWVSGGTNSEIQEATSGVVVLPLLALIQITQYFNFLELHKTDHATLLSHVQRAGGVQGYCGGLPFALAVAFSSSEEELLQNAATALRLAFVIGVFGEIGDEDQSMMVVRLKHSDHAEELVQKFPKLVIAAVTDPKSITVSGSAGTLSDLSEYAKARGMYTQGWPLRGKWHCPENMMMAQSLSDWCRNRPGYEYAASRSASNSLRSNRNGQILASEGLAKDLIFSILVWRSQWHLVLSNAAAAMKCSSLMTHKILSLGVGDCTPLVAFNDHSLRISKIDAYKIFCRSHMIQNYRSEEAQFSDNTIAIVGASCRLPGANNLEELWSLLSKGEDRHRELSSSRFDLHGSFRASQAETFVKERKFYANLLDDVQSFDHMFFSISPREAASMDPQQRILLEVAYEAMESCGYLRRHQRENGDRVACFVGASAVDYHDNTSSHAPTAYTSTGTIRSFLCGKISHYFGWTGPSEVIDTACSSSLVAIARACSALQSGDCTMAVAGGVNVMTSPHYFFDLGRAGFLSPTGQCKPFDSSADGYCRSDGAGLVVLKLLGQAKKDSDSILGLIPGFSTNQGGLSPTITVPHIPAQADLYNNALRKAGLKASEVSYVEAHGTGTQIGDPIEMESIRRVFGLTDRSDIVHVGSLKGNIGHCETAAGVAGLLKVIAMLKHRQIPAQANFASLNPKIPSLIPNRMAIATRTIPWQSSRRIALVNSYGAAGSNSALIVCPSPPRQNSSIAKNDSTRPIVLSAATESSLKAYQASLRAYISVQKPLPSMQDLAYTINSRRKRHQVRTILIAPDTQTILDTLAVEDNEIIVSSPCERGIVLALSGQSRRYIGISRTLYNQFPHFRNHLKECDEILVNLGFPPVTPSLFQTIPITDTVVLQCGLVASQIAFARCWISIGLKIDTVVGHSLGELAALAVCGVLSLRDCLTLVAGRAHLMKTVWGKEKGAMVIVDRPRHEVEDAINMIHAGSSGKTKLEIACYNSRSSHVIVGSYAAIEEAVRYFAERYPSDKSFTRRLDTDFGFHSELTIPILDGLDKIAESLQWNSPKIPLEMCRKSGDSLKLRYSPSQHVREPVFFMDTVQRIEGRLGPCVWVEIGMNTSIIPMLERATSNKSHSFFGLTAKDEARAPAALSELIAKLWRAGVDVDSWVGLEHGTQQIWLPPYQFEKTPHWMPNVDRAAEVQKQASQRVSCSAPTIQHPPVQMVILKTGARRDKFPITFTVNTFCERFSSVLNGHKVCRVPMSPASLYMECVSMALVLIDGSIQIENLQFREIVYQSPLGPETVDVSIVIENSTSLNTWKFLVTSSRQNKSSPDVLHATGEVTKAGFSQYHLLGRLFTGTKQRLDQMTTFETLFSDRAYRMFSGVVQYDAFYKGIRRICLGTREAFADVEMPPTQPGELNNPVRYLCDSVNVDIFLQVLGLLVNSSDLVSMDNVMVGAGIESASFSSDCQMAQTASWKVYATFESLDETQVLGDVMVYSTEDDLVGVINGCRFSKISITRLERLLGELNLGPTGVISKSPLSVPSVRETSSSTVLSDATLVSAETGPCPDNELSIMEDLKQLVTTYTGMADTQISTDAPLGDIGLDSLAAQELSSELNDKFDIKIQAADLQGSSVQALVMLSCPGGHPIMTANQPFSSPVTSQSILLPTSKEASALKLEILQSILRDYSGSSTAQFEETMSLSEIGIDSLASLELKQEISEKLEVETEVDPSSTVGSLIHALKAKLGPFVNHPSPTAKSISDSDSHKDSTTLMTHSESAPLNLSQRRVRMPNIIKMLRQNDTAFETAALKCGFQNYWRNVAPLQNQLLVSYITEAFEKLGVHIAQIPHGEALPAISYEVKHSRLMNRFWSILQDHGLVQSSNGMMLRGRNELSPLSSSKLHQMFVERHPLYTCEADLMAFTGSRLAECLSGTVNPMDCLFGSSKSWKTMEEFYHNAPLLSTATEQLVAFVIQLIQEVQPAGDNPLRILEVGAGTGGTTKRLVKALSAIGLPVRYTFSDISPSLVRKAKQTLSSHGWIDFQVFDLEKPVPTTLHSQFDLVIGTNTVHATSDRSAVMSRLRDTMNETGFAIISETTRVLNWCDLVFGLLDGWWFAEGGSVYPLQPADVWMEYFHKAGFKSYSYSSGTSEEAHTQQLLLACKDQVENSAAMTPLLNPKSIGDGWKIRTLTYKTVNGVDIEADLYLPAMTSRNPMSIVLLIHGGGGVYLSKKSIRRKQIAHLLSRGVLPISLNYRLCPESNLLEGAMVDVRDAYIWARTVLPSLVNNPRYSSGGVGITLDPTNVAAIGYSAGGQLALSLAWTTKESNYPPPKAIVSFYAPVIFSRPGGLHIPQKITATLPPRTMPWATIFRSLPAHPVAAHELSESESTWLRSATSDPRAELIRAFFHEPDVALPLMLNDIPCGERFDEAGTTVAIDQILAPPTPLRVRTFCPLAHLESEGEGFCWDAPTFLVHGDADEIAPFEDAVQLFDALKAQGIDCGMSALKGVGHLFDLSLGVHDEKWPSQVAPAMDFLCQRLHTS